MNPPVLPMLAKRVGELPDGEDWIFEPKWDGFRALVFRDGDEILIQSRDEKPLNRYFPDLLEPLRSALPARCVLDGEIVIVTERRARLRCAATPPASGRIASEASVSADSGIDSCSSICFAREIGICGANHFESRRRELESLLSSAAPPIHLTPATHDRVLPPIGFAASRAQVSMASWPSRLREPTSPNKRVMLKVKHERDCDCVVAGFRWHKKGERTLSARCCWAFSTIPALCSMSASARASPRRSAGNSQNSCSRTARTRSLDHPWKTGPNEDTPSR